MSTVEDAMWVRLTRQGHRTAFNHIVEKYQRPIHNLCYRRLQDTQKAEDATQEIFMRVYLKLDSYNETYKFSSWLFSIASNYCIDRLRMHTLPLASWDESIVGYRFSDGNVRQPEKALLENEVTYEVRNLLQSLPSDYRTALILKYWHKMSYQEISQTLDTTISAIKSKLFRARKMMAQRGGVRGAG